MPGEKQGDKKDSSKNNTTKGTTTIPVMPIKQQHSNEPKDYEIRKNEK